MFSGVLAAVHLKSPCAVPPQLNNDLGVVG